MAEFVELLVFGKDNEEKPGKENYCWRRGDIVAVREEDFKWSGTEGPPIFEVVKIEGTVSEHKHLEGNEGGQDRGATRYNFDTKELEVKSG